MQWEYKTVTKEIKIAGFVVTKPNVDSIDGLLNELGRQKWELVSCEIMPFGFFGRQRILAVLKRPK
jgi:hypothetical protein